jgi:hypothetical protein
MSDPLARIAREMNAKLASQSSMQIGATIPDRAGTRMVKVASGYYLDPIYHRVSNWWTWNEVLPDGSLGPEESGYGW